MPDFSHPTHPDTNGLFWCATSHPMPADAPDKDYASWVHDGVESSGVDEEGVEACYCNICGHSWDIYD
jgi:hypothetical protein